MSSGFYQDMEPAQGGKAVVARGDIKGRIALKADADRLMVVITGEPTGEDLQDCFRAAMDQKLLLTDMRTLVDLTRFVGAVDWKAVFNLRHLASWGESGNGASRVAYLFAGTTFEAALKILSATFARTRHRAFTDRAAAIEWLGTAEP